MPSYGHVDLAPLRDRLRSSPHPALEVVPDLGSPRAVALLAGSFDPLTVGHEALAREATTRAGTVVLVYSIRTLPKEGAGAPSLLGEEERLRVLERFCVRRPGHAIGLASHGLLAEQVEAATERFPAAELVLVMGSDKALQLLDPKWYQDREASLRSLFERARVLYAERSGQVGAVEAALARPANRGWRDRFELLSVPREIASISSRRVRKLVARGDDVRALVPFESWELLRGAAG
jgi:nicotinic acid mononucleotide adenylyltransferase